MWCSKTVMRQLIYLAFRDIAKKWKNPPLTWKLAATPISHSLWSHILCRGDLKTMKPVIARARKQTLDSGVHRPQLATYPQPPSSGG
jgi:hypothetical protein